MELRQLLSVLWRRKWTTLSAFAAVFLTIVAGTLLIKSSYDTTAQVLIRRSAPSLTLLNLLGVTGASTSFTDTDRADYLALTTVRPVIEDVIARTNLTRVKTRANILKALPFLKPVLRLAGVDVDKTEEKMKYDELTSTPILSYLFPMPHLEVEQVEASDLMSFTASSPDPEQAMRIANAAAQAFIDSEVRMIKGDYATARAFLLANISRVREGYASATQDVKKYKQTARTYNIDAETTVLITKVFDVRNSIDELRMGNEKTKISIKEIETRLKSIPKFQKDSEQIKSNDMILSLKQSLRDLYLSLAETRTKYTKDHPAAINYENMIAEAKGLMQGEMERVFSNESSSVDPIYKDYTSKLSTSYIDLVTNEYQDAAYRRLLDRYEGELASIPEKSAQLSRLGLNLTITQDVYTSLQKYLDQLEIAEAMAISNVTLVQAAVVPDRSDAKHRNPSLPLNTVIAVFLGTMFGVGAGFLAEYLDDTVRSPGDVEGVPGCSVLGSIGEFGKGAAVIAPADGSGPVRESFTSLRAAFHAATRERPVRFFAVVSPGAGEGKSFVAGNLAAALAREGKSVLLVDANLRAPAVHQLFGLPTTVGITSFLAGQTEADTLPLPSGIESLQVVTAGPSTANPLQIVDSPKLRQYLQRASAAFEFVVVDTPPLLRASEAILLATWAGSVVLVVRAGSTPKDALRRSSALLSKAGVEVVGVVLNRDYAVT